MIQRRSVATAGLAFASHIYQAWNYLPAFGHSAAALFPSTYRYHQQPILHHPLRARTRHYNQYNHHYSKESKHYAETHYYIKSSQSFFSQRHHRSSRLFGSKSGCGIPGAILIQDDQKTLANIDLNRLQRTALEIRKHLAATTDGNDYETYDVSIYLVDDEAMQEANHESRKINKPTDILSFQFHDAIAPGKLEKPLLDVPDYYNLGDILIDVPYVIRSCDDDLLDENNNGVKQEEEDAWVDDDRGVSGAMSKVFDPELRINMLLIHGMLHLVGYDHEDDADYELMVKKEEEILEILQRKGILKLPTSLA
jgi:probable rRNA maturation factor